MHETAELVRVHGAGSIADDGYRDANTRWTRGSRDAFEQVYRAHVGRIYAICLRMTADPSRAEEHTQETFVRAWEKRTSYRGDGDLFTWLRRIAINAVLTDGRDRAHWRDLTAEPPSCDPDTTSSRRGRATPMDLERAIAALPSGARVVLVLHDIEGYSHPEIGGLLGLSPTTSRTQLHRARKLLRMALS